MLLWRHLVACDGLSSEGIFRTEPSGKLRDEVRRSIVENKFEGCDDPNVCASIIKAWLRGLCPRLLDHIGEDAVSFRVATESCERTISEIEKKCSKLAFVTFQWILDRMLDVTSRAKKNRMNPNALATIFAMCMVSEQKEIKEGSAPSLAMQMAMVRTREHQFAVRDFLVKCMELRAKTTRRRTISASSKIDDDESDDTDTDSDAVVVMQDPIITPKTFNESKITPRRKPIPSSNIDNDQLQSMIPQVPKLKIPVTPTTPTTTKSSTTTKIQNVSPASLRKRFISRGDPEWVKDEDVKACTGCGEGFTMILRKHHCRYCGRIFCKRCAPKLRQIDEKKYRRICATCRSVTPAAASSNKENGTTSIGDIITDMADAITTPIGSKDRRRHKQAELEESNTLQRFDGNLDKSTVMALQRFLNSTRDDNPIDVNGEFTYNEDTRYAFNEETNEALHEFLGVTPVEKETTGSLICALRAYVNRRASWARAGRHSSLRMVRKYTTFSSSLSSSSSSHIS